MRINPVILPGAAAATWVNIAREISSGCWSVNPRSGQIHDTFAPQYRTLHRPEMRIRKRDINGLHESVWPICRQSVAIILVAVGGQLRDGTLPSLHARRNLAPHTRIFCISQRTFQVCTDFNRSFSDQAPLGSSVIRACGKRCPVPQ